MELKQNAVNALKDLRLILFVHTTTNATKILSHMQLWQGENQVNERFGVRRYINLLETIEYSRENGR